MSQKENIHSLFAGSFDPPTLGHMAIAAEALMGANELTLLVAANPAKADKQLFTPEERVQLFRNTIACYIEQHAGQNDGTVAGKIADALKSGEKKINVISDKGLTIDAAQTAGACKMVRGLRANGKDLDDENTLAYINHLLVSTRKLPLTTVMVAAPDPDNNFVASSTAKGLLQAGGTAEDLAAYVAPDVLSAMQKRLAKEPGFEPGAQYEIPATLAPTTPITGFMPGDFTLFTNAHRDIALRSLAGLDTLVIGVNEAEGNEYFKPAERVALIRKSLLSYLPEAAQSKDPVLREVANAIMDGRKSFEITSYSGPFLFAAKEHNASIISRGLQPAIAHLTSEASMAQIIRIESDAGGIPVSIEHTATPKAIYQQLDTKRVIDAFKAFGADSASAKTLLPDPVREALTEKLRVQARTGNTNHTGAGNINYSFTGTGR